MCQKMHAMLVVINTVMSLVLKRGKDTQFLNGLPTRFLKATGSTIKKDPPVELLLPLLLPPTVLHVVGGAQASKNVFIQIRLARHTMNCRRKAV
jgi:hypothetical protein